MRRSPLPYPIRSSIAAPGTWQRRPSVPTTASRPRSRRPVSAHRIAVPTPLPPVPTSTRPGSRSPTTPARRLLCDAADAAWLAGDAVRTWRLLDDARLQTSDPRLLARADQLRGHLLLRRGPVSEGYPLLAEAAERVAAVDPERAVVMLAESVFGAFYAGHTAAMVAAAERAAEIRATTDSDRAAFFAEMAAAMAMVGQGRGEDGAAHARRADVILQASGQLRDDPRLVMWATFAVDVAARGRRCARPDRARVRAGSGARSRRQSSGAAAFARARPSNDRSVAGRGRELRRGDRACRRAWPALRARGRARGLAWLEARQGREQDCRRHADRPWRCATSSAWARSGFGRSRRSAISSSGSGDRPTRSTTTRPRSPRCVTEHRRRRSLPGPRACRCLSAAWRPAAGGRGDGAVRCRRRGQGAALGACPRCPLPRHDRGGRRLGAGVRRGARASRARRSTCSRHARTGWPSARGCVARSSDPRSRAELRAALETFERLGADPWAEQARVELAATGETRPAPRPQHARRPHAAGVPDRAAAGRGHDHARGGRGRLPQPQDH